MLTLATPCDGMAECLHSDDESWLCTDKQRVIWILLACLAVMIAILTTLKYQRHVKRNIGGVVNCSAETEDFMKIFQRTDFSKAYDDKGFWKNLNVIVLYHKWVLPESRRVDLSHETYHVIVQHFGGNDAEAKNCMKKNLHHSVYKIVHEDKFPGIMRRYSHRLELFLEGLENRSVLWWVLSNVRQCFTIYLDIFKDFYIAMIVFTVSGGFIALFTFPTKLTSVVFFCFIFTILLPLLISSHVLARDRIQQLGPSATRKEKMWTYTKTVSLSLLNPLLIVNEYESKIEKMKRILKDSAGKEDGFDIDAVIKLLEEQDILQKQYLEFLKVDLGLETIYQTAGQFILLFLAEEIKHSDSTATTGGSETIFENDSEDFLRFSIFLSLKTCVSLYYKSVSLEKPFFPITSKILVHLLALFSVCKRIFIIVIFFVPSFGLFRLLTHLTMEQIPFAVRQNRKISSDDILHIFGKPPVLWSEVDR